MKKLRYLTLFVVLFFSFTTAFSANNLLIKAHHPSDKNTILRIWKTPKNEYIIRTSYSNQENDFDQEKIYQYQKKVDYDGFAKRVTFKCSDDSFYVLAYKDNQYAIVFGFYSDALKDIVSVSYIIDFINKKEFDNL